MTAFPLFIASACAVGYVLIGYPALLAFLAGRFERAISKREHVEPVSVVICVRNGERWLRQKLESVAALDYPAEMLEVIVVSDGSTDGTEEIARSFSGRGVILLAVPSGGNRRP